MNDRELLELAAKAAGVEIKGWTETRYGTEAVVGFDRYTVETWDPLTDDADAFRLAVKLRLTPMMRALGCDTTDLKGAAGAYERWGDDPCAATRRAIVRAAAEIGRSME